MKTDYFKISFIYMIIGCLIISMQLMAQTLGDLEKQYDTVLLKIINEKSRIDSLNTILNVRVEQIEKEKNKSKVDEARIKELMAQSVIITNQISQVDNKLRAMEKELSDKGRILEEKYTRIIDSLNNVLKQKKINGSIEEINALLLNTHQKKIIVSPYPKGLSFQPGKILFINLSETKDSVKKAIYIDYLKQTLVEVDDLLNDIQNKQEELKQINRLENLTKKFLAEAEFESGIKTSGKIGSTQYSQAGGELISADVRSAINTQSLSYFGIINQLSVLEPFSLKTNRWQKEAGKKLSFGDYLKMLEDLQSILSQYRIMIVDKIK
jgi:hypothetical protein